MVVGQFPVGRRLVEYLRCHTSQKRVYQDRSLYAREKLGLSSFSETGVSASVHSYIPGSILRNR
jgi:hypothetical protein